MAYDRMTIIDYNHAKFTIINLFIIGNLMLPVYNGLFSIGNLMPSVYNGLFSIGILMPLVNNGYLA